LSNKHVMMLVNYVAMVLRSSLFIHKVTKMFICMMIKVIGVVKKIDGVWECVHVWSMDTCEWWQCLRRNDGILHRFVHCVGPTSYHGTLLFSQTNPLPLTDKNVPSFETKAETFLSSAFSLNDNSYQRNQVSFMCLLFLSFFLFYFSRETKPKCFSN